MRLDERALQQLQALPKDALPVSRWPDEDDAWADVAQALRRLITA